MNRQFITFLFLMFISISSGIAQNESRALTEYNLGFKYLKGESVKKDLVMGRKLVQQAAEKGLPEAQYTLSALYRNGIGGEKNKTLSLSLLNASASQGYVEAEAFLGQVYSSGMGNYDISRDQKIAIKWFKKAALKGHATSQNKLGFYYKHGRGVDLDKSLAASWFLKAAEQGDAWGQFNIARAYEYGIGVPKDINKALIWFEKSAQQGNLNSSKAIKELKK